LVALLLFLLGERERKKGGEQEKVSTPYCKAQGRGVSYSALQEKERWEGRQKGKDA